MVPIMIRKINNSFIWGCFFASVTWGISLYLYQFLNLNHESALNIKDTYMHYHLANTDEKYRMKNNDKSIALVQGEDLLSDSPSPDAKYAGNVWKYRRNKQEYQRKMLLKEKFIKNMKPGKTNEALDKQYGIIRNAEDVQIRDQGYSMHAFNALISQRIGNHRSIPDTRNKLCQSQKYPHKLPKASIIICFYNEHYETLMRSVHSILDRTDLKHLKEIILVDDYSDIKDLHSEVDEAVDEINKQMRMEEEMIETNNIDPDTDYINDVNGKKDEHKDLYKIEKDVVSVRLLKTSKREGLIRARLYGADNSVGEILVFLDSHIEVNVDWLPPLLNRLSYDVDGIHVKYSARAVAPIIDVINADTFEYTASPLVRGGFNWGLHFKWDNLPKGTLATAEDFVKPIISPTMAGGLFAIYREYFKYIGTYDAGMDVWGGENLEISFRVWMCGGSLEIVPCSRVGHVFRKRRPYGLGEKEDHMLKNSMRMAKVWMDDYVSKVIEQNPSAAHVDVGDITDRQELRKRLQCKSFQWFLDNIYPEMAQGIEGDNARRIAALNDPDRNKFQPWYNRKRNYTDSFQIRLKGTSLCIQPAKDIKSRGSGLVLSNCIRTLNQIWFETAIGELVVGRALCLDAHNNAAPVIGKCHELGGSQEWKHKGAAGTPIYNTAAGMCLGVDRVYRQEPIVMVICDNQLHNQWDLVRS